MDNQDNGGYERTLAFSRDVQSGQVYEKINKPPQPEYLELINDGFVPEQREVRGNSMQQVRTTGIRDDSRNESVRSENITQYDYIDDQFVAPGIYNETANIGAAESKTSHSDNNHNSRSVCECLWKYKLILIAAAIGVIIITVSVITVISLTMAENSEQSRNGDDESKTQNGEQTTGQTNSEPTKHASLVVIGGHTSNGTSNYYDTVQIYTVDKGHVTWNKYGTPVPYQWEWAGTAASEGDIYIVGGQAWDSNGQLVELGWSRAAKYNVRDDRWEFLPNKTMGASYGPVMYVINNQLYAADGDGSSFTPTEKLDLSDVESSSVWTREQAEPIYDVQFTQAVVIGDTAYICAGTGYRSTKVISWTYGQPAWTRAADMNIAREWHGTVTDGISNIWVVGGCLAYECWPDGFIEHYNLADNTWTKLNHVPDIDRDNYIVEVCSFWHGYIYVIFSKTSYVSYERYTYTVIPRFHVYNTQTGEWHEDSTELMLPVRYSMSAIVQGTP